MQDFFDDLFQAVLVSPSFNRNMSSICAPRDSLSLLPFCNIPLLDYNLEHLFNCGIRQLFLFLSSPAELAQVESHLLHSRFAIFLTDLSSEQRKLVAKQSLAPSPLLAARSISAVFD